MRNLFVGNLWTDGSTNKLHRPCPVVTENGAQFSPSSTHARTCDIRCVYNPFIKGVYNLPLDSSQFVCLSFCFVEMKEQLKNTYNASIQQEFYTQSSCSL